LEKIAKISLLLALSLGLSSCSWPRWIAGSDDFGTALVAGEGVVVHFFTSDNAFDTGVRLRSSNQYALDITILSLWIDSMIDKNETGEAVDERGFADNQMPFEWTSILKRSRDHRWFELMMFQPNCVSDSLRGVTDLNVDEASGSYNFVAACDGKLTLFVNDSYGFYGNNVGFANISLSRVN
jgi:hypothetical protein